MLERTTQKTPDTYEMLMDSLSINIAIYEAVDDGNDFILININQAAQRTERLKKEDVLGKRISELYPNIEEFGLFNVFKRVYKTGVTEIFEPAFYQDERIRGWRKNEVSKMPDGHIIAMYEDHTEAKKLKSKLNFLGEIVDHSINEIYIFNCDTLRFSYANQGALNNLGFNYTEILQMSPLDIKPFHTKESFSTLLKPLCDGLKKQLVFETVHRRKDKSIYHIEVRLQYMKIDDAQQVVVIGTDISERKHSEQVLQKSLKRLADTERIAHFGGWEWDMQTNALQWSDEVFRIFGEAPQSFAATYEIFLSYLTENDQMRVKSAIDQALENNTNYKIEHSIILKNEDIRQIQEIGEFIYDEDGKAVKMVGGVMDITDYKQLKDALSEQEEIYSRLFHQSKDGMMINDRDGRILDYNQSILDILKLNSVDVFLDKQPFEFAPEFQPDGTLSSQIQIEVLEKASHGTTQRFEWQAQQSTGQLVWIEITLTSITINGQQRVHSVWRDISKHKEMQKEIAEFNEELTAEIALAIKTNEEQSRHMLQQSRLAQMGEMISMIAHQWRQPLASISAIAGTLTLDVIMDDYKKEFFHERLEAIDKLSQHLSSTINDFRGFFKEDKEVKSTSVRNIIQSALQIIKPTLNSKGITIDESIEHDIILTTYPNELIQVLLNLLKNAEEAFEDNKVEDPKISIQGYKTDKNAYISVADNAGGIPEEIMDKVFDPYFSTKTKKDGTGLGLYMSKTIIEEHYGGKLHFQTRPDGTLFSIGLPLSLKE